MKSIIVIVDDFSDLTPELTLRLARMPIFKDCGSVPIFEVKGLTAFSLIRSSYVPDFIVLMAPKLAEKLVYPESIKGFLNTVREEQYGFDAVKIAFLVEPGDESYATLSGMA